MNLDLTEPIKAAVAHQRALHQSGLEASAPTRNEAEVASAWTDLWSKLKGLGAKVNWAVVMQQLWTILMQLAQGKNVGDIVTWLLTLFTPGPTPGPAVGT